MSDQQTLEELEKVKQDLQRLYGLFIMRHENINKFLLLAVLKDGEVSGINPSPEVLRIYALKEDGTVKEWVDTCTAKSHKQLDVWLQKISEEGLCPHVRVVFSLDECETIQHFNAPNLSEGLEPSPFDMIDNLVPE